MGDSMPNDPCNPPTGQMSRRNGLKKVFWEEDGGSIMLCPENPKNSQLMSVAYNALI